MSSPLILSFDLRVTTVMDAMWPIISNRDVLACESTMGGTPWNSSKMDEFCIKNEEFCIKNEGFCI